MILFLVIVAILVSLGFGFMMGGAVGLKWGYEKCLKDLEERVKKDNE